MTRAIKSTMNIFDIISNADDLIALEPSELAGVILTIFNFTNENSINRSNFVSQHTVKDYPREKLEPALNALMEAWVWLEREGLIIPQPGDNGRHGWCIVSRQGQKIKNREDLRVYQKAGILPVKFLDPRISTKVYAAFLRGDYETAIFQAFREVEIQVRNAGRFPDDAIGTRLMRDAFGKDGPLTDKSTLAAEQDALQHLFAGAIGLYKNPHSHRRIPIADPQFAAEAILLANHLLGIVSIREMLT
jgi:uncharacterized protein (TIGR02391 family)